MFTSFFGKPGEVIGRVIAAGLVALLPAAAAAQNWPDPAARFVLRVEKVAGLEMTDKSWAHIHHTDTMAMSFTVKTLIEREGNETAIDVVAARLKVRYTIRGIPISDWMAPPAVFVVDPTTNTALTAVPDGISDISVEVQGLDGGPTQGSGMPTRLDFRPLAMFVHIARGQEPARTVPIITANVQDIFASSGTTYVSAADRRFQGHPANPTVTPWHTPPPETDLYQDEMQPHSDLFQGAQMWWEEPAGTISAGLKFVRALAPKSGEYFINQYDNGNVYGPNETGFSGHRAYPTKDGPRGVGWTNGYVQGQVDSQGGLVMVNIGGALRYMKPDGELITVAGWRVRPDKDPVWIAKSLNAIRQNMELRGTWINGQYATDPGFHMPMDVTIDPRNESIWYVAGMQDNCIWKVVVDRATWQATVSVFAGDPNHSAGLVDGVGTAARFSGPFSLTFDPASDLIYVSDHNNDAIRKITRNGTVTTLINSSTLSSRLQTAGALCSTDTRLTCWPASSVRPKSRFSVTASEAASGVRPDVYFPYTVRVDSRGDLIVFDRGFNSVRRINPSTFETTVVLSLPDAAFDGNWIRGWAWLDVDRWGNAGPLDGIYLALAVSYGLPSGENQDRFNESYWWISSDGSQQRWVFGTDFNANPDGWGARCCTDPPHYPWLVAVDPRGSVYLAGIGEHGITRLRRRWTTDPVPADYMSYLDAKRLWGVGSATPNGTWYTVSATPTVLAASPPALKFGWGGKNYLGFPSAWDTVGKSDSELISMFELPPALTTSPSALTAVLRFLRMNGGEQVGTVTGLAPTAPRNLRVVP